MTTIFASITDGFRALGHAVLMRDGVSYTRRLRHIVVIAVLSTLSAVSGCGYSSGETEPAPKGPLGGTPLPLANGANCNDAAANEFRHNAGTVLAGATLSHAFSFKNNDAETIRIVRDEDIRKNCGCSTVRPESRALLPGQFTQVFVELGTAGEKGPLRKGGEIIWTLKSGATRSVTFQIEAEIAQPFTADPELLTFSDAEVRANAVKEVALTSNVEVDWTTLSASSSSSSFQVVASAGAGSAGRVTVRCQMPEGLDNDSGHVFVSAQTRPHLPDSPPAPLSFQFGVRASRTIDLAIHPRPLLVRFDKVRGKGNARCLLRGEKLAALGDSQTLVESIDCPGFSVEWSVHDRKAGSRLAVVELSLILLDQAAVAKDLTLTAKVIGNDPIVVPLLLTEQ